jgi:hypothetical protein
MTITNEKIEVTIQMLVAENMTRGQMFGIPVDPANPSAGLSWKTFSELKDSDFDKMEEYFLNKQKESK